jgi:hypothetical protein
MSIKTIDEALKTLPYVAECVWHKGEYYLGLDAFIDNCIESSDEFYESVTGSNFTPLTFIDSQHLAEACWRHVTGQSEDSDRIKAESLFNEAVAGYLSFSDIDIWIEPKGLEALDKAIEAYCQINESKWLQMFEDIASAPSRAPYPASSKEQVIFSRMSESESFKALAEALARTEVLYEKDRALFDEGSTTIELTEEWWVAQGWKRG